jgi:site-specific DNA-methyltransferase (adenine-specific)
MVLARKPVVGTVANNVLTYGVGGLNIDGSRVGSEGGTKLSENDFVPVPDEEKVYGLGHKNYAFGKPVDGLGRFPANFIHDGSDEVVALFPSNVKGQVGMKKDVGDFRFITGDTETVQKFNYGTTDSGSAARFFYCAKASKRDRNEGLDGFSGKEIGAKGNGLARKCATCSASVIDGCECVDRTFINPSRANHHPTVKPTSLMQYLVRLITPGGGIVLDPFMGSGSTGKACAYEGFDFIGIEQSAEYVEIAQARIDFALQDKETELPL